MSRVGKAPIPIPQGVTVQVDGERITVKGPKGSLAKTIPPHTKAVVKDGRVLVESVGTHPKAKAFHGLSRALLAGMVQGVAQGFSKQLQIEGVGFKAEVTGKTLSMYVGFTHPSSFIMPDGVTASVEKQTLITLTGADKQLVGDLAARIRSTRPPEPYKGKGIRYLQEHIRRKAGKAAATGTGAKKA